MDTMKTEEKHVISGIYKVQSDECSVVLPKQLDGILVSTEFPQYRHRWNTNEEIASLLISFGKHKEWIQTEVKIRPSSGSMLLYSRNQARYRKDGYCWKKRKDGKNIREDHMKLKVQGLECIYGSYVHSDILPTFHRRCYWLLQVPNTFQDTLGKIEQFRLLSSMERIKEALQNPDIVLVHYLNVPYPDNTKVKIPMMPSCTLEKKEWTKEDLVDQLKPMFSTGRTDEESEQMIEETVEALVRHLIEYHENSKRIERDRLDQKKLQESMIHSNIHPPETHKATYPQHSNMTQTTSCINQQIASFASELQHKSNMERKNEGNSGYIVHHKASNLDVRNDLDLNGQSVSLSQVPYILSVNGHLNVPSTNYVVVNGQGGVISPSASLSKLHHAIDSVPPNVVISQGSLNSNGSSQFVHDLGSHIPTKVENSGERSPTVSIANKCANCNFPVQFSSQCRSTNVLTELKGGKADLVPHLSTVTAEDVQNVIQSHESKEKSGEDPNSSTTDQLNGSLGSSDFDHLDLELPDIDKLCSFLGSPLESSPTSHTSVTTSTCTLNNVSCSHDLTQCQGHNHDYSDGGQGHSSRLLGNSSPGCKSLQPHQDQTMVHSGGLDRDRVDIVDICPEWSFTEGGSKLLVVGPWFNMTSQYTCVIDGNALPTTCIQPGVLRCYTPAHREGYAALEVTCDGHVISSPIHIEYKVKLTGGKYSQWFDLPEKELRMLLIDRLNYLEERLAQSHYRDGPIPSLKQAANNLVINEDLEGKLLWYIKMFSAGTWNDLDTFPMSNKYNMTLLHLSAALGYSRLIQAVINWRCDNPSWFLDCEVDANCLDINSCTAMMWACVKGHEEAASALFHWNSASLKIRNKQGLSPLDLAQENGHTRLHDRLLTLQQDLPYNDSLISGDCFSAAGTVENSLAFPVNTKSHDVPFSDSKTTIPSSSDCDLFKPPAPVYSKNKGPLGTLHIEIPPNSTPTMNSDRENLLIRRQSDQALRAGIKSKRKLSKRLSVDLPSHSDDNRSSRAGSCDRPIREANSEPHLPMTALDPLTRGDNPMLSSQAHNVSSPDSLITSLQDSRLAHLQQERMMGRIYQHDFVKMDTDDVPSSDSGSPLIDVEKLSSDEEPADQRAMSDRHSVSTDGSEEAKQQMVTLAKQIIAAIPERIKYSPSRGDDFIDTTRERSSSYSSIASQPSPHASSYGEDSGISTPMGDSFAFEEYRYPDINTPASSMSPESTCLPSPYSPYSFTLDSPPPTTAEFTEYFNAPATYMEKDFSQLTLSDQEQRRLYEAAKVIQKTYRQYRDKQQLQQQQQKEIYAAILIQKYYRRYKQYAYYKKMTQAAVLIQSQFRSYYAQKRFKKSRDAAVVIQNQYRTYKEHERLKKGGNKSVIIQQRYRSHYQRKNLKGQSSGGQVVQIVPESAESSPQDQSNTVQDMSNHQEDEPETPTGEIKNEGATTSGEEM